MKLIDSNDPSVHNLLVLVVEIALYEILIKLRFSKYSLNNNKDP